MTGKGLFFHKKDSKQLVNNYRPAPLLSIYSKVFKKLVFDASFECMIESNLLSCIWPGFKPNDSCINQLISITHSTVSTSDVNPSLEVGGVL